MRAPNPQTFSRALGLAEGAERGQEVKFTGAQARALVYETAAQQGIVHYTGGARSHAVSATEVWEVAGFDDVQRIVGSWCGRPDGLIFAISVIRPNGGWHIDIFTPALPKRRG